MSILLNKYVQKLNVKCVNKTIKILNKIISICDILNINNYECVNNLNNSLFNNHELYQLITVLILKKSNNQYDILNEFYKKYKHDELIIIYENIKEIYNTYFIIKHFLKNIILIRNEIDKNIQYYNQFNISNYLIKYTTQKYKFYTIEDNKVIINSVFIFNHIQQCVNVFKNDIYIDNDNFNKNINKPINEINTVNNDIVEKINEIKTIEEDIEEIIDYIDKLKIHTSRYNDVFILQNNINKLKQSVLNDTNDTINDIINNNINLIKFKNELSDVCEILTIIKNININDIINNINIKINDKSLKLSEFIENISSNYQDIIYNKDVIKYDNKIFKTISEKIKFIYELMISFD